MQIPPNKPTPPSVPWKPKPGEYFFWAQPGATILFLCKWWDENGIAYIVVKDVSGLPCNEGLVVYCRSHPFMGFIKPSKQFMEEFVPEIKDVDYAEYFHTAQTDVKETFSDFMSKITTVT